MAEVDTIINKYFPRKDSIMLEGNCIIITHQGIANVIIPGAASGSMSEQVHEIAMAKTYTPQSSFMKTFVLNIWQLLST